MSNDFRGLRVDDTSDDLTRRSFKTGHPTCAGVFLMSSKAYLAIPCHKSSLKIWLMTSK